jgi:hypothetical protein
MTSKQARAREIHAKAEKLIAQFDDAFEADADGMIAAFGGLRAFGEWMAQRIDGDKMLKEWLRPQHKLTVEIWATDAVEELADE